MTPDEQLHLLAIVGFTQLFAEQLGNEQLTKGELYEAAFTISELEREVMNLEWLIEKQINPELGEEPQQVAP
jgi:hypothetical protein